MSYDLVYSYDGNERIFITDTLDAVNAEIRNLYDEYGSVTILRIEEHHDSPRTWTIEYPPAPPAGTLVQDVDGGVHTVQENGRIELARASYAWENFLADHGPLTEVLETEVQAAARRLREWIDGAGQPYGALPVDLTVVLDHVQDGGTL